MIVVARTTREAKKLYWRKNEMNIDEFIALRINRKIPDKPIPKKLPWGVLQNSWIGLFYGLYSWIYENCPFCKKGDEMKFDLETETQVICPYCQKEIKETDVIKWETIKS